MKQELRRIETMLTHLAEQHKNAAAPNALATVSPQTTLASPAILPSFEMRRQPPSQSLTQRSAGPVAAGSVPAPSTFEALVQSSTIDRASDLGKTSTLSLPRLKAVSLTSHRNAANPSLAVNLLKAIEGIANRWHEELRQVLRQIQDVYLEGPIVDGWLESYAETTSSTAVYPSDVAHIMNTLDVSRGISEHADVEQTHAGQSDFKQPDEVSTPQPIAGLKANAAGYRLCGLNEDGQLWFRHCPAEQLPAISVAIARYQRLKHLLARKQYLEMRLSKLAETLVVVHGQLNGASTHD